MKRTFTILIISLLTTITLWAQVPQKMSYQAVIRDANNNLVVNQSVGMRISILQGSVNGTAVYIETQSPTTNANGLVTIEVGSGTTSYDFSLIDWSTNIYYVKTETDITGGTNYTITGVNQLLSVPYALHSKSSETFTGVLNETDPVFSAWDKSTGVQITESQITDLQEYITEETDPVFSAWDKSTGINILANQVTDLDDYISDMPVGTYTGEMMYWDGSKWHSVIPGKDEQILRFCNGKPMWGTSSCPELATITTVVASDISALTAKSGGEITSDGDAIIIGKGIVWSDQTNPTIDSNLGHNEEGDGDESFISNLSELTPETTYYLRAYAINCVGVAYGNQISFITEELVLPTVTTSPVSEITTHSAITGGNLTHLGGDPNSVSKGVVWSTNENPTIENNTGINYVGEGLGSFTSEISNLNPGTTYYVKAFATNILGTNYGTELSFSTEYSGPGAGVIDIEGNEYSTIIIGNQEWMSENLKTTKYQNGDNIITGLYSSGWENTTEGAYAIYPHESIDGISSDAEMLGFYGALYNWYAVSDTRGLCPTGWRIPSHDDWTTLERFVCSSDNCETDFPYDYETWFWRGTDEGLKLKSCRQVNSPQTGCNTSEHPRWNYYFSGNPSGTDDYGFSAFAAGKRNPDSGYNAFGSYAYWWTSSSYSDTYAWYREMHSDNNRVRRYISQKSSGHSVRCIKVND